MRTLRIGVALILVLSVAASAPAESILSLGDQAMDAYEFSPDRDLVLTAQATPDLPLSRGPGIYDFHSKSPAKAFAYSLLVPGLGQLYTGSKLKGIIFMGVEALGWAAWAGFRSSGAGRTDDYEEFARAHWFDGPYWDSLQSHRGIDKWEDGDAFAHHLPFQINAAGDTVPDVNNEYYENIGKYDQFVWGWDDLAQISAVNPSTPETAFQSQRRLSYVVMREDANTQYDHARVAGILIISNHVLSALEAAFSARRFNRRADRASRIEVDLKMVNIEDTPTPWLNFAYRF